MSGMSKAESYMRKFGWEPGMVLGKNQEGLKKPLTVEKKDDNLGVGFTRTGKTFEWWANVYNNAASATKIEKPKTVFNDAFHTGGVQHTLDEPVVAPSEPTSKKHNEEKLFEECEGRTLRAHKPTGKLARLAEQDKAFRSKKRAKDTEENSERGGSDDAPKAADEAEVEAEAEAEAETEAKKEKKHKKDKSEKKEKKEKRRRERKAKEEADEEEGKDD